MQKSVKYVDTNVLLDYPELVLELENVVISMTVLEELDNLKRRGGEVAYRARKAVRAIKNKLGAVNVKLLYNKKIETSRLQNDNKIIMYSVVYGLMDKDCDSVELMTNDINMELKANAIFNQLMEKGRLNKSYITSNLYPNKREYKGWVKLTKQSDIDATYEKGEKADIGLEIGTYVIEEDISKKEILLRFIGDEFVEIGYSSFCSKKLGAVKPFDVYQLAAIYSLKNDDFIALIGLAGSGKTLLSLSYAFHAIETRKFNKLIIAVNPIPVRDVAQSGFYKGDKIDKLLQGSLGAILVSKLGSKIAVMESIKSGLLEITSVGDCRGRQINKGEILYIPEAQNLTIDTTKLMIQRVEEGAKLILDGDYKAQVDANIYAGQNNGLARAIEVFKNYSFFGTVYLPNIYRSEMANIAENM